MPRNSHLGQWDIGVTDEENDMVWAIDFVAMEPAKQNISSFTEENHNSRVGMSQTFNSTLVQVVVIVRVVRDLFVNDQIQL